MRIVVVHLLMCVISVAQSQIPSLSGQNLAKLQTFCKKITNIRQLRDTCYESLDHGRRSAISSIISNNIITNIECMIEIL